MGQHWLRLLGRLRFCGGCDHLPVNEARELARRYKEIDINAARTADYRDWSPYFFWGCGLPGAGFVPGSWHLNSTTGYAMDHTRLEDLKQKRLDRMTESERAEFDETYEAEKARHGTEYGK